MGRMTSSNRAVVKLRTYRKHLASERLSHCNERREGGGGGREGRERKLGNIRTHVKGLRFLG